MRLVSSDMMEALSAPVPQALSFSDEDINQYLKKAVKPQGTVVPGVELTRALVRTRLGVLRIFSETSVLGYPVFLAIDYQLAVKDGKFTPTIVGGAFGRIPVDPQVMQYCDSAFGSLWGELERPHKEMNSMQRVTVRAGGVDLVTKGARR